MRSILALAMLLATATLLPAPAEAQSSQSAAPGLVTLRAALGGAMPNAKRNSYLVANLLGNETQLFSLSSSAPLEAQTRPVFDARPQLRLGSRITLGQLGRAKVSLDTVVSAGAIFVPEDEPRPMLGLASLRLIF